MEREAKKEGRTLVLVVDDDKRVLKVITALLDKAGYQTHSTVHAREAKKLLAENAYDVVVCDILMPNISGMDLLKFVHRDSPDVPVILITGNPNLATATEAVRTHSAVDYLTKPFTGQDILMTVERAAELKRVRDENKRLAEKNRQYQLHLEEMVEEKSSELATAYRDLRASYDFSLEAMVGLLDARERATGRHSIRVRDLVLIVAREMNLPPEELEDIARGTLLHDIGKIGIPDAILLKQDKLTDDEWAVMRTHVQIGYDIVKASKYLAPAAELVFSHHEKYDGSGYPRGRRGDEICLGARIFAIIDAYDAMRSVRIYQDSIPAEQATEEIVRCSGSHFDPSIVEVFLRCRTRLEETARWNEMAKESP